MKKTQYKNIFVSKDKYILRVMKDGKPFKKTLQQGLTIRQAKSELRKFKNSLEKINVDKLVKLNDWFDDHIQSISNIHSTQSIKSNISNYNKHIKPRFGNLYLQDIKPQNLQKMANELYDTHAPKTVKNIFVLLSRLFNKAKQNKMIDHNPVELVEFKKFDNKRDFYMTESNIKNLINTITNYHEPLYRNIFTFLLHGRRLNEVLSLTKFDIDLDNRIYYITPSKNKARKMMSYKMTDVLYNIFTYQIKNNEHDNDLVFQSLVTGSKIQDVSKAWKRILKEANITKHVRVHDIRHLIGYYSINHLNLPIEHVSFVLGHTDIKTTQKYVYTKPDIAKDVIDKFLSLGSFDV